MQFVKKRLIVTLLLCWNFVIIGTSYKQKYLLEQAGLTYTERAFFQEALIAFKTASSFDLVMAAEQVVGILEKEINIAMEIYANAFEEDKGPLGVAIEILSLQKDHLKDFVRIAWYYLSYRSIIKGYTRWLYQKLQKRLHKIPFISINYLASVLERYLYLERVKCLKTDWRAKHYFVFQNNALIPEVVNIWAYKPLRWSLVKSLKQYSTSPSPQSSLIDDLAMTLGKAAAKLGIKTTARSSISMGAKTVLGTSDDIARGFVDDFSNFKLLTKEGLVNLPDDILKALQQSKDQVVKSISGQLAKDTLGKVDDAFSAVKNQADDVASNIAKEADIAAPSAASSGVVQVPRSAVQDLIDDAMVQALRSPQEIVDDIAKQAIRPRDSFTGKRIKIKDAIYSDKKVTQIRNKLKDLQKEIQIYKNELLQAREGSKVTKAMVDHTKALEANLRMQAKAQIKDLNKFLKNTKDNVTKNLIKQQIKELKTVADDYLLVWQDRIYMTMSMMLQVCAMMSTGLNINWINEKDAEVFAILRSLESQIKSNFSVGISQIEQASEQQIAIAQQMAGWQISILSQQQQNIALLYQNQQTYLLQTLITRAFAPWYISDSMVWDQYFLYAPMLTPRIDRTAISSSMQGISVIPYPRQQQIFYPTSWAVSPAIKSNNLKDTFAWQIKNNQLNIDTLLLTTNQSTQVMNNVILPTVIQKYPTVPIDHIWYNVGRRGNWQYNPNDNSFYQNKVVTNATAQFPLGGDPVEAAYNYIFTEYIPQVVIDNQGIQTYTIEAEIEIVRGTSPWLAGIIFNGARWISGATDTQNQYRFVGFYQKTLASPISLVGAESFFISLYDGTSRLTPISPVMQIFADQAQLNAWKQNGAGLSLITNPLYPSSGGVTSSGTPLSIGVIYVISIVTQPHAIFVTLSMKNTNGSLTKIGGPYALDNRNPTLFNGHSIGFISSNCSSRFALLRPQELVYPPATIAAFTNNLTSGKT